MGMTVTGSEIGKSIVIVILLLFSSALGLTGCSGPSSSSSSSSISISPTAPSSNLIPNEVMIITANVSGLPALTSGQDPTTAYPKAVWTSTPAVGKFLCEPPFGHLPSEYACYQVTYTAPVAVTNPIPVTITATLTTNPPESASVSFTIEPTASYLYGSFSFSFSGFDANGAVSIAGALNVDQSGNIHGEEDFKDAVSQNPFPQPISGSCQNLTVADTGFCRLTAGGETFQFDFALRSDFELAHFIEDPSDGLGISGSGIIASSAYFSPFSSPSNATVDYFTFGLVGTDAAGARLGMAGTISVPAGSLSGTGVADLNDGGVLTQPSSPQNQNISTTSTSVDSFRRVQMQIVFASSPQRIFTLAIYTGVAIDVSPAPAGGRTQVLTGQFFGLPIAQSAQPSFDNTSLSGVSVFELWGLTSGGTANAIGTLSPSSPPNLVMDTNQAGRINGGTGAAAPETGSLSGLVVAANGRAQFSAVVGAATPNYVAYLDAANSGFLLGTDANVSFGFLQVQGSPSNFSNSTIVGNYATGSFLPATAAVPNVATITNLAPTAALSGTLTSGSTSGAYSFDPTTGRGTVITTGGTILGNNSAVFYIIDPENIVLMGSQQGQPNDGIELFNF